MYSHARLKELLRYSSTDTDKVALLVTALLPQNSDSRDER
jgi:hypothetical protein